MKKSILNLLLFVFLTAFATAQTKETIVLISTKYGDVKVKLYNETPKHRDNFIKLVTSGYYDGTIFHRVIKGFMIQGGDPTSKTATAETRLGNGGPGYTVPAEFEEITEVGIGDVDDSSDFAVVKADNWSLENRILHIYSVSGYDNGDVIRLVGMKKYNFIGELPERYDPLLLIHMQSSMYDWMAISYPRFESFAQLQEGTGVSFENLRVTAREFRYRFLADKLALTKESAAETY